MLNSSVYCMPAADVMLAENLLNGLTLMSIIKIKRIYAPFEKSDGFRILVDRLWPRGISKADAHVDKWMKEIAPSAELRKWFNHEPAKWDKFRGKYVEELHHAPALTELREELKRHDTITLLYAAKDEQFNQAVVLKDFIGKMLKHT
jgi:uncharacterized protein YeaO (DUF488 family)